MKSTASALFLQFLIYTITPFLATASRPYDWPAGIDPSKKYWPPGEGPPSKRWLNEIAEAYNANQSWTPESLGRSIAVKKIMDPSEKFMPEYWNWNGEENGRGQHAMGLNSTYNSPVRRNVFDSYAYGGLFKRQTFQCAAGTHACSNIGRPQSCCNTNEQCFKIPDTGFGDVGCCINGQTCSGNLDGCGNDKKTCSSREGGGCCTEGYNCSAQGCVPAQGQGGSSAAPSATPTTTGMTSAASTCSSGYYACPTNLAGGCCPSGRLCGVSECPPQTTTATPVASGDTCPTGYYTCSAQFNGGCCRIGRDCGITNCPERATTFSSGTSQGATANVITGGSCAAGWSTCPNNVGGGCCPSGYSCGASNCPAVTLTGTSYTISGATMTQPIVLPETNKRQPTAGVTFNAARHGKHTNGVREVIVVVGMVVGVVANL